MTQIETQIETILFDLDGTLIDTEPTAVLTVKRCFSEWNLEADIADATYVTGRTWESALNYLFKKYPIPVPEEEAKKHILNAYHQALKENLITVPGGVQAVRSLAKNFPLGLVSGSRRSDILWALNHLGIESQFKVILGAEDYPRSKPNPDGYLKAIQLLNAVPESCLIFEDSTPGIASGRAAGAWVVAITSTNHFNQDLSQAHNHIADLSGVTPEWVTETFPFNLSP